MERYVHAGRGARGGWAGPIEESSLKLRFSFHITPAFTVGRQRNRGIHGEITVSAQDQRAEQSERVPGMSSCDCLHQRTTFVCLYLANVVLLD